MRDPRHIGAGGVDDRPRLDFLRPAGGLDARDPAALAAPRLRADVVGPVCESGDFLALDRELAEPAAGDLLAVMSAGAYGAVQAGTYNSRLLVPEVLVKGGQFAVVRPRPTYAELIGLDKIPAWLS